MVGPLAFVVLGIGLLVYDHLNQRVTDVVFWLTLGLIGTVFGRMLETNRRQSQALEQKRHEELNDRVTGLRNRRSLEADVNAAAVAPGAGWVLVLVELSGLDAHNDRRGYAAGDELLRCFARQLIDAVSPLDGLAYRVAASRLAVLVPAGEQQLGEVVLAATSSLRIDGTDAVIGRAFGEVAIPGEAGSAEVAFQLAGGRLAAQRQGQLRSARRQAHAVLMAALAAVHPDLRDELRLTAYRAISLARRLGMGPEEIDDVALAAELQSVGLLAVPEAILESEADFDATAIAPIRDRALAGERIVAAASGLAPVAALVRSSAERYDGSGEPDGLAGEAIPLGSRIIAAAVALAAMTSPRPHRDALADDDALAELHRCAGTQFDPRVVAALGAELAEESAPSGASAPTGATA